MLFAKADTPAHLISNWNASIGNATRARKNAIMRSHRDGIACELWSFCMWYCCWTLADAHLAPYSPLPELVGLTACCIAAACARFRQRVHRTRRYVRGGGADADVSRSQAAFAATDCDFDAAGAAAGAAAG